MKIRLSGDLSRRVEEKVQNCLHSRHFSPFSSVSRTPNVSGEEDTRVSNAPQTRVDPPRIGPYPKLTNPQDPQYLGPKISKPKPAPQWDFTGLARGLRSQLPSLSKVVYFVKSEMRVEITSICLSLHLHNMNDFCGEAT